MEIFMELLVISHLWQGVVGGAGTVFTFAFTYWRLPQERIWGLGRGTFVLGIALLIAIIFSIVCRLLFGAAFFGACLGGYFIAIILEPKIAKPSDKPPK
jgi:hypothetical protein